MGNLSRYSLLVLTAGTHSLARRACIAESYSRFAPLGTIASTIGAVLEAGVDPLVVAQVRQAGNSVESAGHFRSAVQIDGRLRPGREFQHYRTVPSLTDYLLVSQIKMLVEHYTRNDDATWRLRFYNAPENEVAIEPLGVTLPVAEIYRSVEFSESGESKQENGLLRADDEVCERRPEYNHP